MENQSSIFIINGLINYEEGQVLGVYSSMAAAEDALEVYKGKVAADTKNQVLNRTYYHSYFDDYSISECILDAAAVS